MTMPLFENNSSLLDEARALERKLCSSTSKRNRNTVLVTKDRRITLPCNVVYNESAEQLKVTITGSQGESVEFLCNKIVLSDFRPNQISFLTLDNEGRLIDKRQLAYMSPAYSRILASFESNSRFTQAELYSRITTQAEETQRHARRRWKELKYEYGFDVDYDTSNSMYTTGQLDVPIRDPMLSPNSSKLKGAFLPSLMAMSQEQNGDEEILSCNYCGIEVSFSDNEDSEELSERTTEEGLLDHRKPVFQGGEDTLENLQIFCRVCNNRKNTICRKCPYEFQCASCVWAYPEHSRTRRLVLIFEQEVINQLKRLGAGDALMAAEQIIADRISQS